MAHGNGRKYYLRKQHVLAKLLKMHNLRKKVKSMASIIYKEGDRTHKTNRVDIYITILLYYYKYL